MLLTVIIEYLLCHCINSGIEARKAIAANNGIQATLIAMEIGSQDPEIQSCGLALLACGIIESMLYVYLFTLTSFLLLIELLSRLSLVEVTCSPRIVYKNLQFYNHIFKGNFSSIFVKILSQAF